MWTTRSERNGTTTNNPQPVWAPTSDESATAIAHRIRPRSHTSLQSHNEESEHVRGRGLNISLSEIGKHSNITKAEPRPVLVCKGGALHRCIFAMLACYATPTIGSGSGGSGMSTVGFGRRRWYYEDNSSIFATL